MTAEKRKATTGHRIKWQGILIITLVFCSFFGIFDLPARAADQQENQKQVLFINSYGYDFETVPVVMKEVSERLSGIASVQYLFMNEKYINDMDAGAQLSTELDSLTSEFQYDAVILGDDAAFDFAIQNRDKYFQNIPLIYENINSLDKAIQYKDDPLISGVVEAFPMQKTIELALSIQKNASRVVVITDNSVSGSGSAGQAMSEQVNFPNLKFELFDTSTMTETEIQNNIAAYGSDTILLYTVFNVDGNGKRYTMTQGVKLVTDAAGIPVFKADEAGLGDGLIGGYMLSYQSIGRETANLVLSALNGERPTDVNYRVGSCVYEFDRNILDKYNISKSILPKDSVYINEKPDFFETYENSIMVTIGGAAVLFALILILSESRKRKLRRELEVEEKANRAKTEFISRMSHDIRTPLNAILGMDRLALDEAENPDKIREYLGKAISSGALLTSLVNDILDISKIESGDTPLKPARVSLKEFFENTRGVFNVMCSEKDVDFVITEDAGAIFVRTDPVRLNQIFYNLLTNAVKFTDKGGRVEFKLKSSPRDGVLRCVFTVSDTGCGMSPAFQKRMFDPFSQEEKIEAKGSGLGLSIVKNVTDLMGGEITADSAPGRGTVFKVHLSLPIDQSGSDDGEEREEEIDVSKLEGLRVLLAEDNEINAQITRLMLENAGIRMDLAKDGNAVVKMFSEASEGYYSLILMDNRMPGRTGMEAARAIRALSVPGAGEVPIIALTADAFENDYQKFIDSGMNDCLTKPLDREKLIHTIAKYCSPVIIK